MLYDYIALVFFVVFSIAIPLALLFAAKLVRYNAPTNSVKNAPYESGEATIGANPDIYNEYLPYFMIFIPFEVVVVVILLWAYVSRMLSYITSLYVLGLAVAAMLLALVGYKLIGAKNV
ncbi:MAG: NADH-quinone oxidoreductase subunit A [Candidatus Micrarchaeaceae archaeon]